MGSSLGGIAPGEVSLLPCPVHAVTGVPCPGCGMTRACVSVARGEFLGAWNLHPFAFLLIPLAVAMVVWPARTPAAWARLPRAVRAITAGTLLAACLAHWLTRIL